MELNDPFEELENDPHFQKMEELTTMAMQLREAIVQDDVETISTMLGFSRTTQDEFELMMEWLNAPVPDPMTDQVYEYEEDKLIDNLSRFREAFKEDTKDYDSEQKKSITLVTQVVLDEICMGWGLALDQVWKEDAQ